jgi:hypothetical protein
VISGGNLFTELRPITKDRYSPYQRIPNKECETETGLAHRINHCFLVNGSNDRAARRCPPRQSTLLFPRLIRAAGSGAGCQCSPSCTSSHIHSVAAQRITKPSAAAPITTTPPRRDLRSGPGGVVGLCSDGASIFSPSLPSRIQYAPAVAAANRWESKRRAFDQGGGKRRAVIAAVLSVFASGTGD